MIIQAELRRKQSEYEGKACIVDKVIELPAQRFQQFSHALLADYDFIAENKNAVQYDADSRHCLLILDVVGTDGFLVDPQGYNYARYSAFVPNVRSLLTPDVEIDRSHLSGQVPWRDESRDEMLHMTLHVDGKPLYAEDPTMFDACKAWQNGEVYLEMAYNAYYTNYEIALINTWFIAKTVYPDLFEDIDITAKTNEITEMFLGEELANAIFSCPSSFGGYQKIDTVSFFA